MNRLWSRVGVRAASVGLLLTGLAGGVYLGQDDVELQAVPTQLVVQADADEMRLLKERHAEHAAARAPQRAAEADAADHAEHQQTDGSDTDTDPAPEPIHEVSLRRGQ